MIAELPDTHGFAEDNPGTGKKDNRADDEIYAEMWQKIDWGNTRKLCAAISVKLRLRLSGKTAVPG